MLKKNKDLKDFVMNTVLDRTQAGEKTMKSIMEVLGEKFTQTFAEQTQVMIEKIAKFQQIEENEDEEQIWDRFEEMMSEFRKMKMEKCPEFMLGIILVTGL